MRNVTGREDLITCGQMNEFAWQTDRCKSRRMAFKVLLQRQGGPFVVLLKLSLCLLFKKNYHNGLLLLKTRLPVLSIMQLTCVGTSMIRLHSIKSSLRSLYLLSTLYVTHVINYSRPSTAFPYCKQWKGGWGLGRRLGGNFV